MVFLMAMVHYSVNSKAGKYLNLSSLEPAASTFVVGGLFGIALVPLTFLYWFIQLDPDSCLFQLPSPLPFLSKSYVLSLLIVLFVYYTSTVLRSDTSHKTPPQLTNLQTQSSIWKAANAFILSHFHYFPMTCLPWSPTAKLPPSRQYIFAVHPHGIHCWPLNILTIPGGPFDQRFPGLCGQRLTGLAATILFHLPGIRELFLMMRYVDARRSIAHQVLMEGQSMYVCTGGEKESLLTKRGEDVVVLLHRKGFVRLALSHGADLVPVFGAGVTDLYRTYSIGTPLRAWIQSTFGVALPIFHGRWGTPLPYKTPIRVLIGEPIRVPMPKVKGEVPEGALVEKYHAIYIQALKDLHKKHVTDRTLRIV